MGLLLLIFGPGIRKGLSYDNYYCICFTFLQVYSNGKGLCDTMWGKSFTYEKGDNCMSMWFTGKNPNEDVTRNPTSAATCYSKFIYPAMILSLINLLLNSY